MSEGAHLLPLPRWTVIVHSVQILVAILILALDAYGIHYIVYNALVFSLVTALLTLIICAYIIASTLSLHSLYNYWAVLALHILMVIFWVTDLGLVANLASLWSGRSDTYYYYYNKRDLVNLAKRDTTVGAYYGALAAGAFFGAVQFVLWVVSLVFVGMYIHRHRSGQEGNPEAANPAYTGVQQTAPVEQVQPQQPVYGQVPVPAPQQQMYPQQQPQPQYAQQPVYVQQPQQPQYAQYAPDPVSREHTVSPVSSAAGYTGAVPPNPNSSELAALPPNPNLPELDQRR
ncbi:uncharacterized protein EI97DRAFT_471219 [Westerdykella ornata]|uniref:MARVEL domain-containing protein n=1 Tax=Westerdykella ornata TaxID=318751 RepID=A0A6A6J5E8_WESOR|nr:uncharacterized protein EI97DRAFT_471219 [Westerdykella ornata]KAF2271444.1 hypothetical protein EI97DRAFT_471219 [Westerdykella ornata]